MTIKLDEDNISVSPTQIDDTDSPYLTNGEQYIYVDSSSGPITIQLASSDAVDGAEIRIIDTGESASTNTITIQTEASENINPGSNSSINLTVDGTYVDLFSDGINWFSDRAVEKTSGQISGLQSLSTANAPTSADDVLRWQEGVEVGSITVDGLDNSGGDDSWGQSTVTTVSVTFDSEFNTTPTAVVGRRRSTAPRNEWTVVSRSESTTGFSIDIHQMAAEDRTADAYTVAYVAAEGR